MREIRTVLVHLQCVAAAATNDAAEPGLSVAGQLQRQLHGLRDEHAAEHAHEVGRGQDSQRCGEGDLGGCEAVADRKGAK